MKVLRNGLYYVSQKELARYAVPSYVMNEIETIPYIYEDYITLKNKDTIEYIKNRNDILDYDEVENLSSEELELLYKKSLDELDICAKRWLDTPSHLRRNLYKDKEYMEKYNYYKYRSHDLLNYISCKEEIDSTIKSFIENNSISSSKKKNIKYKVIL